jgi:ribosomal-protein-serine acetyltransferase
VFLLDATQGTQLDTERLLLRPSRRGDLAQLHEAIQATLPELVRWLPWARPTHDKRDSRQYLRHARSTWTRRAAFEYVLEARDTKQLVGMASVHRIDWYRRCAGLGYWIRKEMWGQGFATEAGAALVERSLLVWELHRIEAHIATDNIASQRVIEKLGFQREGIARQIEFVNGRYLDHVQYSLLRGDFLETSE